MRIATLFLVALALLGCKMEKKPQTSVSLGFVALAQPALPTTDTVRSALAEFLTTNSVVTDLSINDIGVTFQVNNQLVIFGLISRPIPWGDLEGPCATSWLWEDATNQMKKHKAQLIVTLLGDKGTLIERTLLLTRLLAAASKAFDAIGIYWGYGTLVVSASQYQKMAADSSEENLPLMAWIEFRIQKNPDGTHNVITTGMEYFGCMEIEALHSRHSVEEILGIVVITASMILQGEVINDGDTVGPDEKTKIKTHHAKSTWDRKGKVLKINF